MDRLQHPTARSQAAMAALRWLFSLALLLAFFCAPASAKKVALVLGIDTYTALPKLEKARNDARAVAATLSGLGFTVTSGLDAGKVEIAHLLSRFEGSIEKGDTAFIFYSGHGVALGSTNYLLPADMPMPGEGEQALVRSLAYSVDDLIQGVEERGAKVGIFVLDACRNNPFETGGKRGIGAPGGLVRTEAPEGVLVLYSAGIGQQALDGLSETDSDANSIFTRKLLPLLKTKGLSHIQIVKKLQSEVSALAASVGHHQQPAYYDQINGEIVLNESADPNPAPREPVAVVPPPPPPPVVQQRAPPPRDQVVADDVATKRPPSTDRPAALPPAVDNQQRSLQKEALLAAPQLPPTPGPDYTIGPPPLAEAMQGGQVFSDCAGCPSMVVVPPGSVTIGSPADEPQRQPGEGPRQQVRIAKPFAVGETTVTFDQWDACVAEGGCRNFHPGDMGWGRGDLPVIFVSWDDAKAYVKWLSDKTDQHYRLLSEAEWEYVARGCRAEACRDLAFWFGNAIAPERANYDWRYSYAGGPKAQALRKTQPVNRFPPNPFGLYNVSGNVDQWVEDCWNPNLADLPADGSPRTRGDCTSHVLRGGSWSDEPKDLRSASRKWDIATSRKPQYGFRVARELTN